MRAFLRFWADTAAAVPAGRVALGLKPDTYEIIGYVDAGLYFLSYPDKFDAVLNWLLGRHPSGPVL
jgi:hypothetical protein